jgi:hypothetical protein
VLAIALLAAGLVMLTLRGRADLPVSPEVAPQPARQAR